MLRIQCSKLEEIRKNPTAYAKLIAAGSKSGGGGTHGMLACVREVALNMHKEDLKIGIALKKLETKFKHFASNPKNKIKQEKLIEGFIAYQKAFERNHFEYVHGTKRINWDIITNAKLTGNLPWVFKKGDKYYSYVIVEDSFEWRSELRFPLFQIYISERTVDCLPREVNIGIYSLSKKKFEFEIFSDEDIKSSIKETSSILNIILEESGFK